MMRVIRPDAEEELIRVLRSRGAVRIVSALFHDVLDALREVGVVVEFTVAGAGVKHNALFDAVHQAKMAQAIQKALFSGNHAFKVKA